MNYWNEPGVSHKGWEYLDIEDLGEEGEERETCEMCGNENIRYVHYLYHPETGMEKRVGCVCAEKMTEDYENPGRRERELKNKTNRKTNFMKQNWNSNPNKHTWWLDYKNMRVTIFEKRKESGFGLMFLDHRYITRKGKSIKSFEEAQNAAFELIDRASCG